jgi:xanthine dehydrogenase YagR molybdenum-binding subunit
MNYIGTPMSRVDGRAKVTGTAKYAAEFNVEDLAHSYVITSTIARGRVARIDATAALKIPGVVHVLTHLNRPHVADKDEAYKDDVAPDDGSPYRPLYDDKIGFSGQPIALVVADEWEIARYAASFVRVEYQEIVPVTDLARERGAAVALTDKTSSRGNVDAAFSTAPARHDAEYVIPVEHHNPMELFATTAVVERDGKLTVYDKTQGVQNVQRYLCSIFGLQPDDLRVVSPFVGGAFGSGLRPQFNAPLAVLAALVLQRSVRLVLTRRQMYALGYRPGSIEHVALGAATDGALEALTHDAIAMSSRHESFFRNDTGWGSLLYKCANARSSHKLVKLDVPSPCDMRGPGAATGVYGLECAMDELAVALRLDPLELRYRNYSDRDQDEDVPYTSKKLSECYRQGAAAFRWDKRDPRPRSMRDGKELIGLGMATGVWEALQVKMGARIVLSANGHAEIACATSDIGTGSYTIMTQVAADMLGLPPENITVRLGDSSLPFSPVEGGSWTAASVSHAIAKAAGEVRKELFALARKLPNSPLSGAKIDEVTLVDGKIVDKRDASRSVLIADAMRQGAVDRIEKEAVNTFEDDDAHARNTHSAVFAEVRVDEQLGVIRVTRIVNAVAAGRILNPKTAGSQIMGGVVWGIGMALHEETLLDHRFGRFVNADMAEYHVPVNADVHGIEVIFVDEPDDIVNPLGIKGVGEIGIVGTAAAIANAIYHATGKRVRELPITLDKLMV